MALKIVYLPISEITPYENNAKIHTDRQIEQIKQSILEFGMNDPIAVCGKNNVIIEGHGRLAACKLLGFEVVPVIKLDNLTEEQRKAYTLVHNKLTMETGFALDLLNTELNDITNIDMSAFGFELEMDDIDVQNGAEREDYIPPIEEIAEPRVKIGDIYQLGKHRLMCGDCTDNAAVLKLFDGAQPDCIVTDPPYCSGGFNEASRGMGSIGTHAKMQPKIKNDTLSTRGYVAPIKNMLINAGAAKAVYIFTDWRMWNTLFDVAESKGYCVRNMIVWDKESVGMGFGWRSQHELCLMGRQPGAPKSGPQKWHGNVIQCARSGNKLHPTQKPVELISTILDITDWAKTIYDPFGGSGTMLIACEQLDRQCFAMELDPLYAETIIKRWEEFTGGKAVKVD